MDATKIQTPPAHRDAYGRGEWDWYFALGDAERRRIVKYWSHDQASGPDVAADEYGTIERWLEMTRIHDAERVAASPAMRGFTELPSLGGMTLAQLIGSLHLETLDEVATLVEPTEYDDSDTLVGLAEVAAMLHKPLRTVSSWNRRGQTPQPVARLKCGPVWTVGQWH